MKLEKWGNVSIFAEITKSRGFCAGKSLLRFAWDYSLSKRYSRTSTCISSSRSILQIMARALL